MNRLTRAALRVQYASDLHLELSSGPFQAILKPVAPILALAGDIGRPDLPEYRNFMAYCSSNWDRVFVVAGNHEFYNSKTAKNWTYKAPHTVDMRRDMCARVAAAFPNITFMNRDRVEYGGVSFLGCTLWTDLSDPYHAELAGRHMNDYHVITEDGERPLTPVRTTAWHREDRAWLAHEISSSADLGLPTVVITHHLPSPRMISDRWADNPLNAAFSSECDDLMRPPVRVWIAGHTHTGMTYRNAAAVMGCVNPRGYPGEQGTGYCRELFVEISTDVRDGDCGDVRDPALVLSAGTAFGVAPREPSGARPLAESDDAPAPQRPSTPEQSLHWV